MKQTFLIELSCIIFVLFVVGIVNYIGYKKSLKKTKYEFYETELISAIDIILSKTNTCEVKLSNFLLDIKETFTRSIFNENDVTVKIELYKEMIEKIKSEKSLFSNFDHNVLIDVLYRNILFMTPDRKSTMDSHDASINISKKLINEECYKYLLNTAKLGYIDRLMLEGNLSVTNIAFHPLFLERLKKKEPAVLCFYVDRDTKECFKGERYMLIYSVIPEEGKNEARKINSVKKKLEKKLSYRYSEDPLTFNRYEKSVKFTMPKLFIRERISVARYNFHEKHKIIRRKVKR